jgi:hypothetical protein
MSWLTENPWPLLILLCSSAAICLILRLQRSWQLSGLLLLAAAGVYFAEQAIVTGREQLELRLDELRLAFIRDDLQQIRAFLSPDAPQLLQTAESGLKLVQVSGGVHLKEVEVQVQPSGQQATVHFRANGPVLLRESQQSLHMVTRWKTIWELTAGEWLLQDVQRLDPLSGQPIGILSAGD